MSTFGRAFRGSALPSRSDPSLARELLSKVEEHVKPDYVTKQAVLDGQSPKLARKVEFLKKKGWRFTKRSPDTFDLISPEQRIGEAKSRGISFKKSGGKIIPVRKK